MIYETTLDRAMYLLSEKNEQIDRLIAIVKVRDEYLEKAVGLLNDRETVLTNLHGHTRFLTDTLKAIAEDPRLLKRAEYQTLIAQLPSTH